MFEKLLIKVIRGFVGYFSNLISVFPLEYHCKCIDDDSASGVNDCFELGNLLTAQFTKVLGEYLVRPETRIMVYRRTATECSG